MEADVDLCSAYFDLQAKEKDMERVAQLLQVRMEIPFPTTGISKHSNPLHADSPRRDSTDERCPQEQAA